MPYFSDFSTRFASFTLLAVLLAVPAVSSAQVGYGGGGGGGIPSLIGVINVQAPQAPQAPQIGPVGQVLGASIYNFRETLRRGAFGEAVMELQKFLIQAGFLELEVPNGTFGPATEAAVKAFQSAHGLEPVGILGPLTRALLNKGTALANPAATISQQERTALFQRLVAQLHGLLARLQVLRAQQ
ncbi:MAG: peptidoglycan-binding domain-containing protein [bacterium]|nr:peptidoglycan-binding domain-containing protein [bacterium]